MFGSYLKFGSCLVRGWFVLGSFLMFTLHVFRTVRVILPSCVWHVWMSAYARAPCNRELTPDDTCHCSGRPPAAGYHQPDQLAVEKLSTAHPASVDVTVIVIKGCCGRIPKSALVEMFARIATVSYLQLGMCAHGPQLHHLLEIA